MHWVLDIPYVFPHGTLFPNAVRYDGPRARWRQEDDAPPQGSDAFLLARAGDQQYH